MPSWATRRSSSGAAGRASRAVARKRSRPASQVLAIASCCGGTPVESSHRTTATTALAMWRARPARLRSRSAMSESGRRVFGFGGAFLDVVANRAIGPTIPSWGGARTSGRMLLDEGEHPLPGVVASVLPLVVAPIEEAVRRPLVHVLLERHACLLEPLFELGCLLGRRGRVVAGHHHEQRRPHLRDEGLAPHRPAVKADTPVDVRLLGGLVPGVRAAEAEADGEHR